VITRRLAIAGVALTIVGFVAGGTPLAASQSITRLSAQAEWVKTAKERLARLHQKTADPGGYKREKFGPSGTTSI
jgi:hypothetical protein